MTLLYVIPWIFVLIALGVTVATACVAAPRIGALPPVVETALTRAADGARTIRGLFARRRRYRAFDRALADFRRNARVFEQKTMDDIVGTPRD